MKLIIDIPEEVYQHMMGDDLLKSVHGNICYKAVCNGTPIPDNATNGDVVKTLFSNTLDNFCERTTWEWNRWWNSPYQKGGKE